MSRQEPLVFIVSGEASGDNLAGRLMGAIKAQTGVRFAGVGGPQSEAQGLESLFPMGELSIMGLAEVLPHLPRLIKRLKQTAALARELKPDVIVTIDSPGFCMRLADKLRDSGIPIVHYVAPQFWAWRPGRVSQLTKRVDHVMALLPFEVSFFADHDIPCTYVGHPAIEAGAELGDGRAFRARHNLPPDAPVLCVVPGSRNGEVRRILPVFTEALLLLKQTYPDLHVVIPVVQSAAAEVTRLTRDWPLPVTFVTDMAERFDAFAACDAAMAKSGILAPIYLLIWVVRRLARVKYASLVNLLADREVAQELLQEPCTPENITAIIDELLRSSEAREAQREGFRAAIEALGERVPPPSERAAKVVLDAIRERGALEAP